MIWNCHLQLVRKNAWMSVHSQLALQNCQNGPHTIDIDKKSWQYHLTNWIQRSSGFDRSAPPTAELKLFIIACKQKPWSWALIKLRLQNYQNWPHNRRWSHKSCEVAVEQMTTSFFNWLSRVWTARGRFEIVLFQLVPKMCIAISSHPVGTSKTIKTVGKLLFLMGKVRNTIWLSQ